MSGSVYLLTGEGFLTEEALQRLRVEHGTDPLSEVSFADSSDIAGVVGALETPSLLGGTRLVVLRGADGLTKDQAATLLPFVEEPSPHALFVLVAAGRTKLDAQIRKTGNVIALDPPKGKRLAGWVRERARDHKLILDDRGAWALIDTVGTGLRDLEGAVDQLLTTHGPGSRIGATEVRNAFPRLADERIFALTDAVGDRRLPVAMTALRRLLQQGDAPLLIFGALVAHMRRLLRARRYADQGPGAVAGALGLPDWRAKGVARQARTYREEELVEALRVLADADFEMKNGDVEMEVALERAVYRIVSGERVS